MHLLLLLLVGLAGPAQVGELTPWETPRYRVFTDDGERSAREVGGRMEAAFRFFSGYFHFDPDGLTAPLKVRIFSEKSDFDRYLSTIVPETRLDFVLISYSDPRHSELVGFRQARRDFDASLLHQGFIQYLKAFIPGAPVWLQAGMAAYLERAEYDPAADAFRYRPNLSWLPTLKRILRAESPEPRFTLEQLITMDREQASAHLEAFYAQSWGLVYFLIHSEDRQVNRALWDAISALHASRTTPENAEQVRVRAFAWMDEAVFRRDFEIFMLAERTFTERVQSGIELYGAGRLEEADGILLSALELDAGHPLPYYYLGLIRYARREYAQAEAQYRRARELGIEAALIHYALGVNAFAERRYEAAEELLRKARALDAELYGEKADALLKRIGSCAEPEGRSRTLRPRGSGGGSPPFPSTGGPDLVPAAPATALARLGPWGPSVRLSGGSCPCRGSGRRDGARRAAPSPPAAALSLRLRRTPGRRRSARTFRAARDLLPARRAPADRPIIRRNGAGPTAAADLPVGRLQRGTVTARRSWRAVTSGSSSLSSLDADAAAPLPEELPEQRRPAARRGRSPRRVLPRAVRPAPPGATGRTAAAPGPGRHRGTRPAKAAAPRAASADPGQRHHGRGMAALQDLVQVLRHPLHRAAVQLPAVLRMSRASGSARAGTRSGRRSGPRGSCAPGLP
jgi:tetratricopeptide (TPR) repeat protein